jgi:hypothetical protein
MTYNWWEINMSAQKIQPSVGQVDLGAGWSPTHNIFCLKWSTTQPFRYVINISNEVKTSRLRWQCFFSVAPKMQEFYYCRALTPVQSWVYLQLYLHADTQTHKYPATYAQTHTQTDTHTQTHTQTHTHTHTHTHTLLLFCRIMSYMCVERKMSSM